MIVLGIGGRTLQIELRRKPGIRRPEARQDVIADIGGIAGARRKAAGIPQRAELVLGRNIVAVTTNIGTVPCVAGAPGATERSRARYRSVPVHPRCAEHVVAAEYEASDGVIRASPVLACLGQIAIVQRVNPFVAIILESCIEATKVDVGAFAELVVRAAGQPPACAVILVITQINAVV